jgi:hypothetical protein
MNTTTSNAAEHHLSDDERQSLKRRDERLFQVIFVLSFPVFLAIVMATRLLPTGNAQKDVSMLSEASQSARSTIATALAD